MLESDQNLEKSMAIFQDMEKILAPYCNIMRIRQTLFKLPYIFKKKIKHLNS